MLKKVPKVRSHTGRPMKRAFVLALSASLATAGVGAVTVAGSAIAHAASTATDATYASGDAVTPLVSYNFDNDSSGSVADSSGNGLNATWQNGPSTPGTPSYAPGIYGQAAHVNTGNANENIKLPLVAGKTDGSGSFAVEFWWYDNKEVSDSPFFGNQNFGSCGNAGIAFYHNGGYGQRTCGQGLGYAEQNNTTTFQNQWVYYTLVYDATAHTYSYYINGQLAPVNAYGPNPVTTSSTVNFTSGMPFYIGNDGTGQYGSYDDGYVDDFNFYDQAISPSQVAADYSTTDTYLLNAPAITIEKTSVGSNGLYSSVDFDLHAAALVDKFSINGVATSIAPVADYQLTGIKPGVDGAVEGSNTLTMYTADGNSVSKTFTLDSVPPTISLNQNPGMTVGSNGTYDAVSFVLADNNDVGSVSIDGHPITLPSLPIVGLNHVLPGSDYAVLGDNTITVADEAGNTVTQHFTLTDAPIVTFVDPSNGAKLSGSVSVTADIGGAGSKTYALRLDNKILVKTVTPVTGEVSYTVDTTKFKNGEHVLSAAVTDSNGHTATTSIDIKVAN